MTDREKLMIETYLPNPRDLSLDKYSEYYVKDTAGRVHRAILVNILCVGNGLLDAEPEYGMYDAKTRKHIDAGYDSEFRGFSKSHLYDNYDDCKNDEHFAYNDWEKLREIQEKEYADLYGNTGNKAHT